KRGRAILLRSPRLRDPPRDDRRQRRHGCLHWADRQTVLRGAARAERRPPDRRQRSERQRMDPRGRHVRRDQDRPRCPRRTGHRRPQPDRGSPVDTDSYGLYNGDASHTVEAVDNWWGCNEGPSGARCDPVAGAVDVPSWLVLGLAASNASPGGPGAVEITARLGRNSDGLPVDGPADVPVSFRDGSGPGSVVDPPTLLTAAEAH